MELIHLNDLLDDVTFTLLTNQRPRKCDRTERQKDRKTFWHYDDQCPPGNGCKKWQDYLIMVTTWQCDNMTTWYDNVTMSQYDNVKMWQYDNMKMCQCDFSTIWQPDNVTMWQYTHKDWSNIFHTAIHERTHTYNHKVLHWYFEHLSYAQAFDF